MCNTARHLMTSLPGQSG